MRNIIFAAAALLAVAAPGIAAADTGGALTLTVAGIDSDIDSKNGVVALSGVVITDLPAEHWRLQINASGADADLYDNSFAYSQIEAHVVYSAGMWEFGGVTGITNTNGFAWYEYGVEVAVNFDRARIQASAVGASSPNTDFDNITTLALAGSYDITDNLSIGASVSSTDFNDYGNTNDNVDSWQVDLAYTIPDTHFTVAAGYRGTTDDDDDTNFFGISLTWGFGDRNVRRERMIGAMALIPDAIADE